MLLLSPAIARGCFHPVCLCVCVCLCLSRCLSGRFNYEGLVPQKNILQVHCWGCLVVQVMFHALMTLLMTSQDQKVSQILKLIYLRQYLSYSVDQKITMSEMPMAIFLEYSTSGITPGKKVCRELKMAAFLKISKYQTQLQFHLRYKKDRPKLCQKSIFMMMTSSMTSQGGLKVGPLCSLMNEITTFFMITEKRAKISSLNFLCIGIMSLWLQLCQYIFMASLMASPGNKKGQILKLIYFRQYLS